MLKYVDTKVVFQEIPNEIALAVNISNCPCHCEGCHSSYLADDIGEPLTGKRLRELINANNGITCVLLMGGDDSHRYINVLASIVKWYHPAIKVAWYSGRTVISNKIDLRNFDYIKVGPYIKELGPLDSKSTNQRLYKVDKDRNLIDITYLFQKS